jgi:hypothetical protein
MNAAILALITYYSGMYGIDPNVAVAVAQKESQFRVDAVGSKGEIGLFQLMPSAFPNKTKKELFNPKTNIQLGIKHLAWNKKYCKHKDDINYLVCYNYGIKNAEHVKYPHLFPYVKDVRNIMSQFKKDQKVMVQGLHYGHVDGEGIYLGVSTEHGYVGYLRIQNEFGSIMKVEPQRVTDYVAYWEEKKKSFAKKH